jgi:hypothetical protein
MLAHLPIIILASFPLTTVADSVPKFDIARECRSEGGSQATLEQCAADEAKARDQLQPQWTQFSALTTKPFASLKPAWTGPPAMSNC